MPGRGSKRKKEVLPSTSHEMEGKGSDRINTRSMAVANVNIEKQNSQIVVREEFNALNLNNNKKQSANENEVESLADYLSVDSEIGFRKRKMRV